MWLASLIRNYLLKFDNLLKELDNAILKNAITKLNVMNFTDAER